ncbi:MAG: hypothetical protein ACYCPO_11250 [Acidobacteriaceae bacterium]
MNLSSQKNRCLRAGYKYLVTTLLLACVSGLAFAKTKAQTLPPGLQTFTPTRIDWLTTTLQASLRDEEMETYGFLLEIASPDSETILIYVRYMPDVNREVMNMSIDSARQVIQITAKSYGWDKWLKIREDVQLSKPDKKR